LEAGMSVLRVVGIVMAVLVAVAVPGRAGAQRPRAVRDTVEALLALDVRPIAIGHRGFGENRAGRPIENTVASVREAFRAGISVVEVDVQLTRDQHVVAYHDDVLPDFTCLNTLTLRELQARLPFVPTLESILGVARGRNHAAPPLQGIVIVELKAARPLCDPLDEQDGPMVAAATRVVRHMRMTEEVLFTSFSPAMLDIARLHAPEIARILAVSGLQFLSAADIATLYRATVTVVDKEHDLGLQWAEVGTIFRLPGYRSLAELIDTAIALDTRVVEADLFLLQPAGSALVPALHTVGLEVFGFTVNNDEEWTFLESLGVDGIYTNDIPLGLAREPAIP
jgi:glycerophosphoryl diester phosphodiesterase